MNTAEKLACRECATAFFMNLDRFDDKANAALMAEDIVWIRPGGSVVGKEACLNVLSERPRNVRTRHLVTNLLVRAMSENEAQVDLDVMIFKGDVFDGTSTVEITGPFAVLSSSDVLVRDASTWRISRKTSEIAFSFPNN